MLNICPQPCCVYMHLPRRRPCSAASVSRRGDGRSRSSRPGRSRWGPPGAPCTCCTRSRRGANTHCGWLEMQTRRCRRRLSGLHTAKKNKTIIETLFHQVKPQITTISILRPSKSTLGASKSYKEVEVFAIATINEYSPIIRKCSCHLPSKRFCKSDQSL